MEEAGHQGGMGGMMGGMGMGGGRAGAKSGGVAANVRQVGNKTFYRKADRWVDSEVKPEDDARAKVVEQFSDEFFKIARSQSAEMNQYLGFDEAVTVNLAGQVYRFDPPKGQGNTPRRSAGPHSGPLLLAGEGYGGGGRGMRNTFDGRVLVGSAVRTSSP